MSASANSCQQPTLICLDTIARRDEPLPFAADVSLVLSYWQARPGMIVTFVDAQGASWRGRLLELGPSGGVLLPFYPSLRPLESPLHLTVYQALPARERFELILEKLTELGVTRIVPCTSRHSSTRRERDAKQQKSHRWPEVLRRASVQCRRAVIPALDPCLSLAEVFVDSAAADLRLLLYEGEGVQSLKEALQGNFGSVALLVGPEGGFAPEEVAAARTAAFLPVSIGPRILRTETAAISAATIIQFALGDLF